MKHRKKMFLLAGIIAVCLMGGIAATVIYKCLFTGNQKGSLQASFAFYDAVSQKPLSNVWAVCVKEDAASERIETEKVITDEEGLASFNLAEGEYTICCDVEGYYGSSDHVVLNEEVNMFPIYLIPCVENNSAYIIVQWNGSSDIDLCIYCEQEGRCVGQRIISENDSEKNFVVRDNALGTCELAYIDDLYKDSYIIFLKKYGESTEKASEELLPNDIRISVYNGEGLLYREQIPLKNLETSDQYVLYEWGSICEGSIESRNCRIEDLTHYRWAARDKYDPALWISESLIQAEETYSYNEERIIEQITRMVYDERGDLLVEAVYDSEGICVSGNKYESNYDENEKLVMKSAEYYIDGALEYRTEETYDAHGNCVSSYVYNSDGSVKDGGWSDIQYDENENILVDAFYRDGMDQPYDKYEYTYDEEGRMTDFCEYGRDGLLERRIKQEYDESGQVRRRQTELYHEAIMEYAGDLTYEAYGDQPYIEVSEYDADGNQIGLYVHARAGIPKSWWEAVYNANGDELFKRYYVGDALDFWTESQYDDDGNLTALYTYEDEDRNLRAVEYYEYTAEGRRETMYGYAADGKTKNDMEIREYDIKGNMTLHARTYDFETWVYWDEAVYDEKGNNISCSHYAGEKVLKYRMEMEYDFMNNEVWNRTYFSDGTVSETTSIYTYDAAAGIVTVCQYIDGVKKEKKITMYY